MTEADATLFGAPFKHVALHVKPIRATNTRRLRRDHWWQHGEHGGAWRRSTLALTRYIATSQVSRHRLFVWRPTSVWPHQTVIAVPRADDATFGILHSRMHELWSLRMGTSLEDRPRYTPTTCFDTFAFPPGLTPADTAHQRTEALPDGALLPAGLAPLLRPHAEAIAHAAKRLNDLRERWLNPPEWTRREPEVVPLGMEHSPYPDRILPREGFDQQLAARTLTKLYNERPAWLAQAHEALDAAVAAAYGWTDCTPQMPDEEILRRLLALNRERTTLPT